MPETQSTKRLLWLLYALLIWVGAICVRLVALQIVHHDDLLKAGPNSKQQKLIEIQGHARRHL